jgi:hypothetical protein
MVQRKVNPGVLLAFFAVAVSGASAQQTWRLSEQPQFTIGVAEGPPEQQLFRVAGAFRFSDGRFVIANGGTQEIRIFDARGKHLSSAGRKGEGPGEFVALRSVFPYGDSIIAYDFQLRRMSVFGPDGKYVRSFIMPRIREGLWPQPIGTFRDGSILVQSGRQFMMGDSPHGVNRDPSVLFRMSRDGEVIDSITSVAGWERYVRTTNVNGRVGFTVHAVPFARVPHYATGGDRVFVGSSDAFEIDVYDKSGKLERRIRGNQPNRKVTRADIDRMREARIKSAAAQSALYRQRTEEALQEMKVPETMPAYSGLRTDPDGNLWVQEYRAEYEDHTRWSVFDPQGRLLARVTGPAGFTVHDIGRDYIVGLRTDELDVEHIEVYRLTRGR